MPELHNNLLYLPSPDGNRWAILLFFRGQLRAVAYWVRDMPYRIWRCDDGLRRVQKAWLTRHIRTRLSRDIRPTVVSWDELTAISRQLLRIVTNQDIPRPTL